ncbi:hypothetical protein [Nocardia brasiliensis]|uniref:hypothetical protein n=1 Tax=Nocardia brasiliensis TaxID=37326 RepID=UPI00245833BF|nr:hypothetical protein [Nocardia brasiliensis]
MPDSTLTLLDPLYWRCEQPVSTSEICTTVEGERLCPGCAACTVLTCDHCSGPATTLHRSGHDELLCVHCVAGMIRCRDCGTYYPEITATFRGDPVCESCVDLYDRCHDCGRLEDDSVYVQGGHHVCQRCRDECYRECPACDTVIHYDDDYCTDCTSPHDQIHRCSYRPTPRFHGTGPLFVGMELEINTPSHVLAQAADTALDHLGDLGYLKEDGSIDCGFELVTHPMSLDYALTHFPWPLLNRLRLLGCHTDSEVGIHVHLSRAGFDSPAHIYRWLKFVYRNENPVTRLARRRSTWAKFSEDARAMAFDAAHGERCCPRYQAINVRPTDTFEMRIFASSLKPQQVQAALGFAAGSVEYTRTLTAADITRRRGWEWSAFTTWLRTRPQYSPLLAELEDLACAS